MVERIGADAVISVRVAKVELASLHLPELVFNLLDIDEEHAVEKLVEAFIVRLIKTIFVAFEQLQAV